MTAQIEHLEYTVSTDAEIKLALETSANAAIKWLAKNIHDLSLYLLFEWNQESHKLNIVVTDATKSQDSPVKISTSLNLESSRYQPNNKALQQELSENIKFWLHDYLSTCNEFCQFSLVAIFHASHRNNSELL